MADIFTFDATQSDLAARWAAEDGTEPALRRSMTGAQAINPDEQAKAIQLGQRTGLPPDVVRRNRPAVEQQENAQFDWSAYARSSPLVAKWVGNNPDHAAVVRDDLENLGLLERLTGAAKRGVQALRQVGPAIALRSNAAGANSLAAVEEKLARGVPAADISNAEDVYGARFMTPEQRAELRGQLAEGVSYQAAKIAGAEAAKQQYPVDPTVARALQAKTFGEFWGEFTKKPLEFIATVGLESLPASAPGMLAAIPAGVVAGPLGVAGAIGTGSFASDYASTVIDALRDEGVDVRNPEALSAAVKDRDLMGRVGQRAFAHASVVGAFDALSGGIASKTLVPKSVIKNATGRHAANIALQAPVQGALGAAGEAGGSLASGQEITAGSLAAEFFGEFVGTPAEVASASGRRIIEGMQRAQHAQRQADFVRALGEGVSESKTLQRLPEALQNVVAELTKEGPLENVYAPVEAWQTYWQSKGVDPRAAAAEVTGSTDAYDEALASGADFQIPLDAYARHIAPTEHNQFFADNVSFAPDEMTAAEAREWIGRATAEEQERAGTESAIQERDRLESAARVREDVTRQLRGAGMDETAATANAALFESRYRARGERLGMDPFELYRRNELTISREMPQPLRGKANELDALIDRLRTGDVPTEQQIFGQSLVEFLRAAGGVKDEGGALAAFDPDVKLQPFQRRLIQSAGKSLDTMRERAVELGYLPEGQTVEDFVDLIGQDLSGSPVYRLGQENTQALGVREAVRALDDFLKASGVDVRLADNAAIKALLAGAQTNESGPALVLEQREGAPDVDADLRALASRMRPVRGSDQAKAAARAFLNTPMRNAETGIVATVSRTSLEKMLSRSAWSRSLSSAAHMHAVGNLDLLFPLATLQETTPDTRSAPEISAIRYFDAPMPYEGDVLRVHILAKEFAEKGAPARLYVVQAVEIESAGVVGQVPMSGQFRHGENAASRPPPSANDRFAQAVQAVKEGMGERAEPGGDAGQSDEFFQDTGGKRGALRIGPDRKFSIQLFAASNLSTLLHESGHVWLEEMRDDVVHVHGIPEAERTEAQQRLLADGGRILEWLGVKSWDEIGTEQHEQWARGFEAYLMEGSAPSFELRALFAKFRAWLVALYRSIKDLDVRLNDDVRGVMDRLLAADDAIAAAKRQANVSPVFLTAEQAGMSEAEFAAYRDQIEAASTAAQEALQAKLMAEYQREQTAVWKERRAKMRERVLADFNRDPAHVALSVLQRGKMPDGSALPDGVQPVKLSRAAIVERRGEAFLKRLPRPYVYAKTGGISPDIAADMFGLPSGEDLLDTLANSPTLSQSIETEVDRRMRETYGDLQLTGQIADDALNAVHNELRERVMQAELRALRKLQRGDRAVLRVRDQQAAQVRREGVEQIESTPPISAMREMARGLISQKMVRDINPNTYLVAERRAAQAAIRAAANGDYTRAAVEKQRQMLNYELFKAAQDAREQVDRIVAYMNKFDRRPVRESLGKAGLPYLEQIDAIRERFEFKRVPLRVIAERESLRDWHARQVEMGYEPAIDPRILNEAHRINYRLATFEELQGMQDAVRSIEHLARHIGEIKKGNARVAFEDAVAELTARAEQSRRFVKPEKEAILKGWADRLRDKTVGLDTSLVPVETLVEMLDDGAVGPWHDYLFNRASESQTDELDTDHQFAEKLNTLIEEYVGSDSARLTDLIKTGLQYEPMSRYKLISIALNVGNDGNFDKMQRGHSWTRDQVIGAVRKLDAKDLRFVQAMWDTIGELYPRLSALQQTVSGLPLAKVEPVPITIKTTAGETVELRGGYWPLKYDPKESNVGVMQETGPLAGLTEKGYARATVPGGHRKERTGYAAPLLLDFGQVAQRHIAGVVKDLTHREFLIDANKLLTNRDVRKVLQARLGAEYERMFLPWLKGVANDRISSPENLTGFDKLFESARSKVTIVALGFKLGTIFAQAGGVPNSIEYVSQHYGARHFAEALRRSMLHPLETFRTVASKSGEMRHRFETRDRDTRDELRRISSSKVSRMRQWVERAAFGGISYADRLISVPTWLAAYNGALSQGAAEQEAVHAGDAAVRRSQGAGGAKDLSEIQRRRGAMKLLTMFYTPFAAQYGRVRAVGADTRSEGLKFAPEAVMRAMMIVVIPGIMSDVLAGRGPKECAVDDAECLGRWAAIKAVFSFSAVIPVLRDIGNALERKLNDGKGGDTRFSPVLDAFDRIAKTAAKDAEALFGDREFDSKQFFDNLETSGYLLGMPTAQPRITLEYLYDLMTDQAHPDDGGALLHDLLFRRPKE